MDRKQIVIQGEAYECLFDEQQVESVVRSTYKGLRTFVDNEKKDGTDVVFLVLANGGNWFSQKLFFLFNEPLRVEYALLQSYENNAQSDMNIVSFPDEKSLYGKSVVVIDDILDSGKTMQWVVEFLSTKNVKTVQSVVLCRRHGNQTPTLNEPLLIENDAWVVGCGMDSNHEGRNLGEIYRKMRNE